MAILWNDKKKNKEQDFATATQPARHKSQRKCRNRQLQSPRVAGSKVAALVFGYNYRQRFALCFDWWIALSQSRLCLGPFWMRHELTLVGNQGICTLIAFLSCLAETVWLENGLTSSPNLDNGHRAIEEIVDYYLWPLPLTRACRCQQTLKLLLSKMLQLQTGAVFWRGKSYLESESDWYEFPMLIIICKKGVERFKAWRICL